MTNLKEAVVRVGGMAVSGLLLTLVGCRGNPDPQGAVPPERTGESQQRVFVNGDFESGTAGSAPPSWVLTPYSNSGVTHTTPQTRADLQLLAGGVAETQTMNSAAGAESKNDSLLGGSASLRWPKYGNRVAYLNMNDGTNKNVNSLKQTMTLGAADVDPADGKLHIRFVIAPVLDNPGHSAWEQPYYFVGLTNTSRNAVLYHDFNASAQAGVPWKFVGTYNYTDWQLVDIAPTSAQAAIGDNIELEVIAAGCSLGGHTGRVYVDGVGTTLPGLFVSGTGPAAANDGSNITYTLAYKNGGTTAVAGTTIEFNTPPNTVYASLNAPGLTCTLPAVGSAGLVSCTVGSVAAGASGSFEVTVKINSGTTGTITAGNYDILATGVSPLLGPKVYTTVTSNVTYADLGLTVSNGLGGLTWGQAVSYSIVVTNSGPNPVTGATVTDTLPAQLTGATWTCAGSGGGTCAASGSGSINDSTVSVPVGGSVTYTVKANVIAGSGTATLINNASISLPAGASDPDTSNNSAGDTDPIGSLFTVSLSKPGTGNGTITSVPATISCGPGCTSASGSFIQGSTVILSAATSADSTFAGWSGACSGTGTCTITLGGDTAVTATFTLLPQANGSTCTATGDCQSDNCVDGVCCNTACGGSSGADCQACNLSGKEGTCSVVSAGTTCRASAGSCDVAETCDGNALTCPADAFASAATVCRASAGACDVAENCTGSTAACPTDAFAPSSTVCRALAGICDVAESCTGSSASCPQDSFASATTSCSQAACAAGVETLAASCTGSGAACPTAQTTTCQAFVCGATACLKACAADTDCSLGNYCNAGTCEPQLAGGTACKADTDCSTAHCVDGVCCNTACHGTCEACDVAGKSGTCTAVSGAPHGKRTACATDGSLCGGTCDSVNTDACVYPSNSTTCRNGSCTAGVATRIAVCDGRGACPAPTTQDCAPFVCGVGSCIGDCMTDAACATGKYCSAGVCVAKVDLGKACSASNECGSGFCVEGLCCDAACNGQCQACDISGKAGTCSTVTGAPHGQRPACARDGSACGGTCNGVVATECTYPDLTVSCRAGSCTSGIVILSATCDGKGACPDLKKQACATYTCQGAICADGCASGADCATDQICSAGLCVAKLGAGKACSKASECVSGNCVDGVCCDTACSGQCEACDVPGTLGVCSPAVGVPHHGRAACNGVLGGPCKGQCDGKARSACAYPDTKAVCRPAACTNGVATLPATCDGKGLCPDLASQSCGGSICSANACSGDCTTDAPCTDGFFCSAGVCLAKLPAGGACTAASACTTGFCVDGVCCDVACDGQCQACDGATTKGTCTPIQGAPHGARAACAGTGLCGGTCDGTDPAACVLPDATTVCSAATCSNGQASPVATCDGQGTCNAVAATSCGEYACQGAICGASCTTDSQCKSGDTCVNKACVAGGGLVPEGGVRCSVQSGVRDAGSMAWFLGIATLLAIRLRRRRATTV